MKGGGDGVQWLGRRRWWDRLEALREKGERKNIEKIKNLVKLGI